MPANDALLKSLILKTEALTCDAAENEIVAAYAMMSHTSFMSTDMQAHFRTSTTS